MLNKSKWNQWRWHSFENTLNCFSFYKNEYFCHEISWKQHQILILFYITRPHFLWRSYPYGNTLNILLIKRLLPKNTFVFLYFCLRELSPFVYAVIIFVPCIRKRGRNSSGLKIFSAFTRKWRTAIDKCHLPLKKP